MPWPSPRLKSQISLFIVGICNFQCGVPLGVVGRRRQFSICPRLRRAEKLFSSESEVEGPINLQSDRNKAARAALWPPSNFASELSPEPNKSRDASAHKKPWDSIWDAIKSHSLTRKLLIRRRFVCVITLRARCQREHLLLHWTHWAGSGGNFTGNKLRAH